MKLRNPAAMAATAAALLYLVLRPSPATAQDTNYWSNQYGPRSMLLGGAVTGSVHDMSATFYNPGALGYIADPELLLSANAYQLTRLTVENGGGDGINLESGDFNPLPNMLAGAFRFSWLGTNKFAYSLLTRHRFNAEVQGSRAARIDILPAPGLEDFAGSLIAGGETTDTWTGLTWARSLHERVGIGVTTYLSIYSRSGRSELFAQAMTDSGDVALIFDVDSYESSVYSLLWKAGVGLDFSPVTIGLTVTTPNVALAGSGSAVHNKTAVAIDLDNDGVPDDAFETDLQPDVKANYHAPLSVGLGVGVHLEKTRIHVAAEWFAPVSGYDVLELSSFTSQATGESIERSLRHATDSVFNLAVGVEHAINDRYSGYLSANTDYSSVSVDSDVAITGYDIYHVTGGTNAIIGKTQWMLGLSYAWGSTTIDQPIDLDPGGGAVVAPEDRADLKYRRFTFMIGFSVAL